MWPNLNVDHKAFAPLVPLLVYLLPFQFQLVANSNRLTSSSSGFCSIGLVLYHSKIPHCSFSDASNLTFSEDSSGKHRFFNIGEMF
jgi:hypothetical protein